MFDWLFNYPLSAWQQGTLGFNSPLSPWLLLAAIVVALGLCLLTLVKQPLATGRRTVVFAVQSLVATLLLAMLWQPVLRLEVAEQGENTVAWLVDTSTSMQTEDVPASRSSTADQRSRLTSAVDIIDELAFADDAEFEPALYSQGRSLQPVADSLALQAIEPSTISDIAGGLDQLLGTVGQSALAAVVLVSDGSENADSVDAQWWQRLGAAGVPVHTVGVGRLANLSDIQLSDVIMQEQVAPNVDISARLRVNHSRGGSARVRVMSGRNLISAVDITLPDDVAESVHEVSFPSGEIGIKRLSFEVMGNEGIEEPQLLNNVQPRVLKVADAPKRILYVEGEPRWEYKFFRRALENNASIDVVSLLRTSPNKFYRQGVRDATELADGFPADRKTLFAYDAVIIGSLEAAELNTRQQIALRDFVSVRGGSLLMLAGRHGLADGGWGRSVVSAALPVILDASLSAETFTRERVQVLPTLAGYRTPWLSLDTPLSANQTAWDSLPEVADVQSLGAVKAGAVVLLESSRLDIGVARAEPLLVSQRYGKGRSVVLGTSGTWRWQMSLDSTDQRHEIFWGQLAAMLVEGALPRINVSTTKPVYRDSDAAFVTLNVFDDEFQPLQQSSFSAQLTLPDGALQSVELMADAQQPGSYSALVSTPMDGPYTINAITPLGGESPQSALVTTDHWWVRESGTAESYDNVQQAAFLQRLADATGGSYMPSNDADALLDVLSRSNAALKRELSMPLWNMPVLFLGLILAKALEWFLRLRWRRL